MVNVGTLATHKQITCHRRWRDNLSLGLFEKAILLIIKVELPHQERLKTKNHILLILPRTVVHFWTQMPG